MATVFIVLRQIVIMFVYMAIGGLLFQKGLITKEGSKSLANLLLYAVLPCVVVKSFCVARTPERMSGLLVSFLAALGILLLAMAVSHLLFKKNPIDDFGAAFSNAGFMGFPLVAAVQGSEAIFYAAGFVALLNALQWTYGQSLISGDPGYRSPKAILKNPLVLSLLLGILIFCFELPVPAIASDLLAALAALNAPLAMVILGVYLAQTDPKTLFNDPHLYVVAAARLVLIPLLTILVLKLLPAEYAAIATTLVIVAAAPIGSNVAVYAQKLGKDYAYAVRGVCLSTLLSAITMPLLMLFAN